MIWADRLAKQIIDEGLYKPYWVDDMKTPSGRIHVGSLRGVVIHDLIYKALLHQGQKANFTYVFEDHDPTDELPPFLDRKIWGKYLGQPLFTVPSPEKGYKNYAEYFTLEFQEVFEKIGCHPKIIWVSSLYKTGKMNADIKVCLDKADIIRSIYEEMYKKKLPSNWYPFQPVCPNCGKESTTQVTDWDGSEVTFVCKQDAVPWTQGCNYSGKTSPFSTDGKYVGKLPWKVEWPVKWKVIGVTIEGAGKDHMSAGGSHDIGKLICKRVLNYPVPFSPAYEFFLIGGKKMSSSKGLGSSAKEVSDIVPPYLLRFIFTRTDYQQAIDFEPVATMQIPDYFDEYDRCWLAYNSGSDEDLARTFEMSQIGEVPSKNKNLFIPRFIDIANYIQMPNVNLVKKFEEIKGSSLTNEELELLKDREKYAHIWIGKYAPPDFRLHMNDTLPDESKNLNAKQKEFLLKVIPLLEKAQSPEDLQLSLYNLTKEMRIDAKEAFQGIYTSLIGKTHGPKAAWFLMQYPKEKVIARLKDASQTNQIGPTSQISIKNITRPDLFTIDPAVKKIYPSVSIGIAIIKEVMITKTHPDIEKEKHEFLSSLENLTTEELGKYPEVISYRKLYKQMGIDWHSRRPSPEALLRRVALKKGLYTINTCVDAYNLVVMKHRVSVGAFDLDAIKFPTVLRFPKEGEEILLLGDKEPTKYATQELAYFDKEGGFNIDFNYRDAQRTMVTEKSTNLWINVDGIFDVTPEKVARSLHESVELIIKYCGGTVELEGVVT